MNEWRYLKPMVSTNSTCKGIVGLWRYFMECGGWPPLLRFSALPKSPIKSGSKPPHSKRCNNSGYPTVIWFFTRFTPFMSRTYLPTRSISAAFLALPLTVTTPFFVTTLV